MHRVTWTDGKEDENVKISKICQKKHHVKKNKCNANLRCCDMFEDFAGNVSRYLEITIGPVVFISEANTGAFSYI